MAQTGMVLTQTCMSGFRTHTNDWESSNTGAALTTGDALPLTLSGIMQTEVEYSENDAVIGGVGLRREPIVRTYKCEGTAKFTNLFACNGIARMIACWFGAEAAQSSLGSGAYLHLFTIAANTEYVGDFAVYDNLLVHDFTMTKIESLEFEWEYGAIPTVTVGMVAKREYTDGSTLNTSSTLTRTLVTLPTQPATLYPILASGSTASTIRLKDQSGTTLASGDQVYASKVNLKFMRKFDRLFSDRNTPYIDEPVGGDWLDVSGSIGFTNHRTLAEFTRIASGTATKLDISFIGGTIGGSNTWKWLFEYPIVYPTGDLPKLSKPGVPPFDFAFSAYDATTQPTGMAFTLPRLSITDNINGRHYLNGT